MAAETASSQKLVHKITIRISDAFYAKLESWLAQSNCRTITEVARAILYRERINWYHRSAELESLALEFALIRKELNAIGNNINQITRAFHTAAPAQKIVQAIKAESEYRKVERKVSELLKMTERLSEKWLRK